MCGIIGYVGSQSAATILLEGLKRLEYRGYDSVGVAVLGEKLQIKKDKGTIDTVSRSLDFTSLTGNIAIGHTRWATHGAPCKENAHPHEDCTSNVVLVHNGVIENYRELKEELVELGHTFKSETDSEVIAHLIEEKLKKNKPFDAVRKAIATIRGSYALAIIIAQDRDRLYIARNGSPLILGIGSGEMFCASDIPALLKHTKTFVPLEDGDFGFITRHGYELFDVLSGNKVQRKQIKVDWNLAMAEKGGYPHFMLKEINDQKHFIYETLATDVSQARKLIERYKNIDIIACGTSYHAGLLLALLLESIGKRARTFIASDYSFIAKPDQDTLVVAITQSGETADVLQAVKYTKKNGARVLAITNVVGSSITREANTVVYLNAGPEIGVAATKTFTAQLAVAYMLTVGKDRLRTLPEIIKHALETDPEVKKLGYVLKDKHDIFFIARGLNVPIAYEGSLKFKEISYIHSEAYPGGELKHGTLSLLEPGVSVIVLAPEDETAGKMLGNLKEAKARGALIISFTNNREIAAESDYVISIPKLTDSLLYPFVLTIPLQLLAYHTSVIRGNDPDKPRNLAKSVTVE
ncbi:MAG: glutamine--fructose-6-phosphate transaminase (isomerizing) [Candidatus Bilamarchaeaceae archaeon]